MKSLARLSHFGGCVLVYRYTEGITIVLLCLQAFVKLLHIVGSIVSVLVYRYTRTEPTLGVKGRLDVLYKQHLIY